VAPSLPSEQLGDETFVPQARCDHPTIAGRSYALHPTRGLLRSNDGGKHWKPGLEPLTALRGSALSFVSGEQPLLVISGEKTWLFADTEDAFFP
ncbi:MAG TPA: sialidase family protein, partial [Planctomycetota bacterium]|nr:sialidase family protein [Planctomycetota bacterium]